MKIAVVFVFIAGGIGVFAAKTKKRSSEPLKIEKNELSSSRGLYQANCARCHGGDGKGDTELGKLYGSSDLTTRRVQKMSRKRMTSIIKNGKGSMPAFGKKLSAQEIYSIVTYVRSF